MAKILSQDFYNAADKMLQNYPKKGYALIPLLHKVQKELGKISTDSIKELSVYLELPFNHILGVVTFYTMFSMRQRGKHYVGVCTNLSCWLNGAEELYSEINEYLKAKLGDKKSAQIHLEKTECLGACHKAPVVLLDERYQEETTIDKISKWLEKLGQNEQEKIKG